MINRQQFTFFDSLQYNFYYSNALCTTAVLSLRWRLTKNENENVQYTSLNTTYNINIQKYLCL